jgi:hypothetical protein
LTASTLFLTLDVGEVRDEYNASGRHLSLCLPALLPQTNTAWASMLTSHGLTAKTARQEPRGPFQLAAARQSTNINLRHGPARIASVFA